MRAHEFIKESLPKNSWELLVNNHEKNEYADELKSLVDKAYTHTSLGSFVKSMTDIQNSDWIALDHDNKVDIDCTIFYRGPRANEEFTGYKIQGIGHDGTRESKQKVLQKLKSLLNQPGWWIESSDSMSNALQKLNVPVVTDELTLILLFPKTKLQIIDNNGTYTRYADGKQITEKVFGKPFLKRVKEYNSIKKLSENLTPKLADYTAYQLSRQKGSTKLKESKQALNKLLLFLNDTPKKTVKIGDTVAALQIYPYVHSSTIVVQGFLTPSKILDIEEIDNLQQISFENNTSLLNPHEFESYDADYLVNTLYFDTYDEAKKMVNILQLKFNGELTIGTGMLKS